MQQISSISLCLATGLLLFSLHANAADLPKPKTASLPKPTASSDAGSHKTVTSKEGNAFLSGKSESDGKKPAPGVGKSEKNNAAIPPEKAGKDEGHGAKAGKTSTEEKSGKDEAKNSKAGKVNTEEKSGKHEAQSSKASKNPKEEKSSKKTTEHKESVSRKPRALLVPPPPPSVPTMSQMGMPGMGTTMIFMGENVEYMPLSELKDLKVKTESDLARFRRSVDEQIASAAEKKQRADTFDQLFAEGVVSRKELEQSKVDNDKAIQDLGDAKQTLHMLEQKYSRVEKRIAELSKEKPSRESSTSRKRKLHK